MFPRLAIALGLLVLFGCRKDELATPLQTISIRSSQNGIWYQAQVFVPSSYSWGTPSAIVYLLDGHYHGAAVGGLIQDEPQYADVVLVSISYEDYPYSPGNLDDIERLRTVDFTHPAHVNSAGESIGGGGLLFHDFLKTEFIPAIENRFASDPNRRVLMGHSLGGYFALHELFGYAHDPIFQKTVALSPALWWSDLEILEMEAAHNAEGLPLTHHLFVGTGDLEGVEANVLVDTFADQLESSDHPGLDYRVERYEGGHFHSALDGFDRALQFLFP